MQKHAWSRGSGIVLTGLLLTVWAGCAPSTGQVERGIERELPRLVGPADEYDVDITGLRARAGEADRVTAVGERVRPTNAPVLDRIDVELRDVKYDRGEERIERLGSAVATARITQTDLEAFLENHRNVQDVSVDLRQPQEIVIRARPAFEGVEFPSGFNVVMRGTLVGEDGRVNFVVSDVRAAGVTVGPSGAQRISRAINPIVDFSAMPVPLHVREVRVQDNTLRVTATGSAGPVRL